jgi:ABC-2 type transport system permease protein
MRRPEMKMTLLTPIFMLLAFSRTFTNAGNRPELMRLLMTSGVTAFVLIIGLVGPVGNQFGFDRSGFRAFVLSPVPRRDVLMGKNLAMFAFALPMMLVPVALAQWFTPLRQEHLIGLLFQLVSMYLMFCVTANLLSIVGPLEVKQGSGMPAPRQGIRNFGHLLFMLIAPPVLGLTLLPLGAEALFSYMNWFAGFPAYLVLGIVQAVGTVLLYRRLLDWQGALLQRREQRILEIVGSKSK